MTNHDSGDAQSMQNPDVRCTSQSEDGRRCHGDAGHPGTHWAAASRVWSDTETLVRPVEVDSLEWAPGEQEKAARGLRAGATLPSEVWVVETELDHEPGWIEGVYSTEEKAKAAHPGVTWSTLADGRAQYQTGIRPFDPMLSLTPHALDPEPRP